jgi:hypothetical protein
MPPSSTASHHAASDRGQGDIRFSLGPDHPLWTVLDASWPPPASLGKTEQSRDPRHTDLHLRKRVKPFSWYESMALTRPFSRRLRFLSRLRLGGDCRRQCGLGAAPRRQGARDHRRLALKGHRARPRCSQWCSSPVRDRSSSPWPVGEFIGGGVRVIPYVNCGRPHTLAYNTVPLARRRRGGSRARR